jgi:hypothetical protein
VSGRSTGMGREDSDGTEMGKETGGTPPPASEAALTVYLSAAADYL